MEVKGTAVKSIPLFVKKNYPDRYADWLNSMPPESKKIFMDGVITSHWYSVKDAAIVPTEAINKLFFDNDQKKGAWELGRYSAESALSGIYKLYVRASTPGHIIERANRVFSAYYQPSTMITHDSTAKSVTIHITEFFEQSLVIEYRIAGWIEKALEISGCKDISIDISKSIAKGDDIVEYKITWS